MKNRKISKVVLTFVMLIISVFYLGMAVFADDSNDSDGWVSYNYGEDQMPNEDGSSRGSGDPTSPTPTPGGPTPTPTPGDPTPTPGPDDPTPSPPSPDDPTPTPHDFDGSFATDPHDFLFKVSFGSGASVVGSIDGVDLYNGMPFNDDGHWYKFDYDAVNSYTQSAVGSNCKIGTVYQDDYNVGSQVRDGVTCHNIAFCGMMACLGSDDTGIVNPGFGSSNNPYYYGVAVFEKDGLLYYWPVCAKDNAGHGFPGGVAHTLINSQTSYNGDGTWTMQLKGGAIWYNDDGTRLESGNVILTEDMIRNNVLNGHLSAYWTVSGRKVYGGSTDFLNNLPDYHFETSTPAMNGYKNGGYHLQYFIVHDTLGVL